MTNMWRLYMITCCMSVLQSLKAKNFVPNEYLYSHSLTVPSFCSIFAPRLHYMTVFQARNERSPNYKRMEVEGEYIQKCLPELFNYW